MWAKASALGLLAIASASFPSRELAAQSALDQARKSIAVVRRDPKFEHDGAVFGQARGGFDTRSTAPNPVSGQTAAKPSPVGQPIRSTANNPGYKPERRACGPPRRLRRRIPTTGMTPAAATSIPPAMRGLRRYRQLPPAADECPGARDADRADSQRTVEADRCNVEAGVAVLYAVIVPVAEQQHEQQVEQQYEFSAKKR